MSRSRISRDAMDNPVRLRACAHTESDRSHLTGYILTQPKLSFWAVSWEWQAGGEARKGLGAPKFAKAVSTG